LFFGEDDLGKEQLLNATFTDENATLATLFVLVIRLGVLTYRVKIPV